MHRLALLFALPLACDSGSAQRTAKTDEGGKPGDAAKQSAGGAPANTTINAFLKQGTPTFVVGTLGDDDSDRKVRAQAELIAGLFEGARIVTDTEIGETWPDNPILYGGPHVNAKVEAIATALPFALEPGRLAVGGQTLEGEGKFLMAVVPSRGGGNGSEGWPEFLLYAGTGSPGVGEINDVQHGAEPLLLADAFGRLRTGTWTGPPLAVTLGKAERRLTWRTLRNTITSAKAEPGVLRVHFPEVVPAAPDEDEVVAAVWRGMNRAARGVALAAKVDVDVYVHPDRKSKKSLTGKPGDGHAVVAARVLHVIAGDPAQGGGFESLVAHEGTHVLTYATLGATPSPLLGEGLAVWVSGQYGGRSLAQWRADVDLDTDPRAWLDVGFRRAPEAQTYPIAGLFVGAAIETVGWDAFAEHLLPASAQTWDDALTAAGTSHDAVRTAMRKGK